MNMQKCEHLNILIFLKNIYAAKIILSDSSFQTATKKSDF